MRAVAVLLVLAQHLLRRFQIGGAVPPIGTFGVLIFFVHTCLVLMYSMERSALDGSSLFGNFYLRRVFRIYPLSMLAVLAAVALHLDSGINGVAGLSRATPVALGRVLSNFFLVQNLVKPGSIINVLWSLPYEVQMYIFLPILFLWSRKKRAAWVFSSLWLASLIVAIIHVKIAASAGPTSFVRRLTLLQMVPNFLPGVIAFVLPRSARIKSFLWPIFIFVLIGIYMALPLEFTGWLLCLILGVSIPWFAEIQTHWLRIASNRIATYSYGIYLSHQFCIWFVDDPLKTFSWWLKVPVLVVLLVVAPILLYHFIEKPLIRVGAELADKWSTRKAARVTIAAERVEACEAKLHA